MLKKSIAAISMVALLVGCSSSTASTSTAEATAEASASAETERTMAYFDATYTGSTEAGTVIDENSTFTITEYYQDGSSTEHEDGYEVLKGATLEAGQTAKVDIRYNGRIATFKIECK